MSGSTRIDILVFDGVDELDALAPYRVLRGATGAGADFAVRLVTLGPAETVTASAGLRFAADGVLGNPVLPDILVVPGGGWGTRSEIGAWGEAQRGEIPAALAQAARDAPAMTLATVCTGAMLAAYAGLAYLMDAPFERTLTAIRANEKRVPFLGFNAWQYKLAVYVLAACVAALAGALYPMLRGFVSPELMFFETSGNAVITVIVGGVGTLVGPVVSSLLLTALRSVVGSWTEHHLIVVGIIFMLSVIFLRKGLVGALLARLRGVILAADPGIVFDVPPAERFDAALALLGVTSSMLSADAGHA